MKQPEDDEFNPELEAADDAAMAAEDFERRKKQRLALQKKTPFKLKPHHAKPVRKRHLLGLSLFALSTVIWASVGLNYIYGQFNRQLNASITSNETSIKQASAKARRIQSNLGFSLSFDPKIVDVNAVVQPPSGKTVGYDSYNIGVARDYSGITFTPIANGGSSSSVSSMSVGVLQDVKISNSQDDEKRNIANKFAKSGTADYTVTELGETSFTTNGVNFLKKTYQYKPNYKTRGELVFSQVAAEVYVGVLGNGMPVVFKINLPDSNSGYGNLFQGILRTFALNGVQLSSAQGPASLSLDTPGVLRLAQRLGFVTSEASASSLKLLDESQIIATNAPSVVKIYHVVCGVISYQKQALTADSCAGTSGTGFFVSSDGYIVTNGHVVTSDPKDIVISNLSAGLVAKMLMIDGYSNSDIAKIVDQLGAGTGAESMVTQAIGKLPEGALTYSNQKDYYIVATSSDVPKLEQIATDHNFKETSTVKLAELKGIDYSTNDLYGGTGFKHSDVAVLKLSGSDYPVARLGTIDAVVQGDGITVIGFPGDAESNLVSNDILQSTATRGIVGAVRQVNGGSLKVIQSDVNIGHGNSGGPAFDQQGKVIGVATYLIGGSQNGDAGISYLRDIKDARNLMSVQNIKLNTDSKTQIAWEAGLKDFYSAHYKKAIAEFKEAKRLYPSHVLADHYISISEANIADGQEAQSVWVPIAIVTAFAVSLAGVSFVIVLMVRHRAHHHLFKAIEAGYIHGPFASMQQVVATANAKTPVVPHHSRH